MSPLPLLGWALARCALRTVGRAAGGVRTGCRHGFDSGTFLDYVYAGAAHGHPALPGLGKRLDRFFLDAPGWQAVRARRALLTRVLREEVAGRGGEIRVLDVASGTARYLVDLLAEEQPGGQLRVFCRDLAPHALAAGRRLAREYGLPEDTVTYEPGDAFDPAPLPGGGAPDIIVVAGLYELTADEDVIRTSLERLRGMLAPDGVLLFTTRTGAPRQDVLARVLPKRDGRLWRTRCRSAAEAEAWAEKAGFARHAVDSRPDASGLFAVIRCGAAPH